MIRQQMFGKVWRHIATGSCTGLRQFRRWKYSEYFSSADLIPTAGKSTKCGAVLTQPKQTKFGLLKVSLTVLSLTLLGASLSNKGAELLEDSEIFIPED